MVPSVGACEANLPMRSIGGRRVGKRARHERSEWPDVSFSELEEEEEEEDEEEDEELLERALSKLRFGGARGGAGIVFSCERLQMDSRNNIPIVSSSICGVLPNICPSFALERSICALCDGLRVLYVGGGRGNTIAAMLRRS